MSKRVLISVLVIVFSILLATILFNPPSELSQSPPSVPIGFSPPWDVFADTQIFFLQDGATAPQKIISVNHAGAYVYRYGYYWNPTSLEWAQFTFPQPTVPGKNWIPESANIELNLETLGITDEDDLYVVAYSSKKINGTWYGGCRTAGTQSEPADCNYWMYQHPGLVPPSPDEDDSTTSPSHLECIDYTCTLVQGTGESRCSAVGAACGGQPAPTPSNYDLIFYDNRNSPVAKLTQQGNVFLKGVCLPGNTTSNCLSSPPEDSFMLYNQANQPLGYIDLRGNLCIRCVAGECPNTPCQAVTRASCSDYQGSSGSQLEVTNSSGNAVIRITNTHHLCMTGTLTQNAARGQLE